MIRLVLVLALAIRLIALDQSFWLDEAAQAMIAQGIFEPGRLTGDFQPPLSYFLTYVWMSLGNVLDISSEAFLRVPMVAFGVGTVFLLFQLLKDMFNEKIGLLGSLFLALAPFHIYYSQEHRMYAMLTFFAVLSWYLLWHRRWKWLIVTTTMGVFTHYFAFINIAAQIVYILLAGKKTVHKSLGALALGISPFVLWLPTFMKQLATARTLTQAWPGWENISNTGFIRFPGLVLAKFTVGLTSPEPRWLYGAAVGAVALIALLSAGGLLWTWYNKKSERPAILMLVSMFVLPLTFAWIGGIFVAASSPWRIQFVLPAFYGLLAVGLVMLPSTYQRLSVLLAAYVLLQNSIFSGYYLFNEDNHRENWREAVAYTDKQVREDNVRVLSEYTAPWAPIQWYTQFPDAYMGASSQQRMTQGSVEKRLGPIVREGRPVALYTYLFEISDPERLVRTYLLSNGYELKDEVDFRGVGIIEEYGME